MKADGYGHGARDAAGAALDGGATALCVATVPEALALRAAYPDARILVMGPWLSRDLAAARAASLELVSADGEVPRRRRRPCEARHGHGPLGLSELLEPPDAGVVGLMTHLATADSDLDFARRQLERFRDADRASTRT